jgi:hypothetical protein
MVSVSAVRQSLGDAKRQSVQTAKGLYVPTQNARKKRSHQVIENKGPQVGVGPKRSHQVIENKSTYLK